MKGKKKRKVIALVQRESVKKDKWQKSHPKQPRGE